MPRGDPAKARILKFFLDHLGQVVTKEQLRDVSQINEWARRVRELRDEDGWQILNHNTSLTLEQMNLIGITRQLKASEYALLDTERLDVTARDIDKKVRESVLQRYGATCQLCGRRAGDLDPYNPNKRLQLHIDHKVSLNDGGTNDEENLWPICSICNEGKKERSIITGEAMELIQKINMQTPEVRRQIYDLLREQFGQG